MISGRKEEMVVILVLPVVLNAGAVEVAVVVIVGMVPPCIRLKPINPYNIRLLEQRRHEL